MVSGGCLISDSCATAGDPQQDECSLKTLTSCSHVDSGIVTSANGSGEVVNTSADSSTLPCDIKTGFRPIGLLLCARVFWHKFTHECVCMYILTSICILIFVCM